MGYSPRKLPSSSVCFGRSTSLPVVPHGRGRFSGVVHRPVELLPGALPAGGGPGRPSGGLRQKKKKKILSQPAARLYVVSMKWYLFAAGKNFLFQRQKNLERDQTNLLKTKHSKGATAALWAGGRLR